MADNTNSSFSFLNPASPSLMNGGLKLNLMHKHLNPEYSPLDLDLGKYQAWQEAEAIKEYAAQEAEARKAEAKKAEEKKKKFKEAYMDAWQRSAGSPYADPTQTAIGAGLYNSEGPEAAAEYAKYSAASTLAGALIGYSLPYVAKGAGWLLRAGWNPASTGYSMAARWIPKASKPLVHGVTKAIDATAVHLPVYLQSAKDVGNKILGKENWFTDEEGNFSVGQTLGSVLDLLMIKSGVGEWKPVVKQLPSAFKAF